MDLEKNEACELDAKVGELNVTSFDDWMQQCETEHEWLRLVRHEIAVYGRKGMPWNVGDRRIFDIE